MPRVSAYDVYNTVYIYIHVRTFRSGAHSITTLARVYTPNETDAVYRPGVRVGGLRGQTGMRGLRGAENYGVIVCRGIVIIMIVTRSILL